MTLRHSLQEGAQGCDRKEVASVPLVVCLMGLVACAPGVVSLPRVGFEFCQMACVLVVASLPGVVCRMGLVACVRGVASLPGEGYEFCQMAFVLVAASLPGVVCQMGLVACVRELASLPWEVQLVAAVP